MNGNWTTICFATDKFISSRRPLSIPRERRAASRRTRLSPSQAARAIQGKENAGFNQPVTDQLLTFSNKSIRGKISRGQFVIQEWSQKRETYLKETCLWQEQVWGPTSLREAFVSILRVTGVTVQGARCPVENVVKTKNKTQNTFVKANWLDIYTRYKG